MDPRHHQQEKGYKPGYLRAQGLSLATRLEPWILLEAQLDVRDKKLKIGVGKEEKKRRRRRERREEGVEERKARK